MHRAVLVGELTVIAFGQRFEADVRTKLIQICVEESLLVVVIDLSVVKLRVLYRKIEDAGTAAVWVRRPGGKLFFPLRST